MNTRRRNVRAQREEALAAELAEEARLEAAAAAGQTDQSSPVRVESTVAAPAGTTFPNLPTETEPRPATQAAPVAFTAERQATAVKEREASGEISELDGGEGEDEMLFEDLYKRETYYIRKSNIPRLKRLLRKLKKRPGRAGHTKYELMDEALEYLFQKYDIK